MSLRVSPSNALGQASARMRDDDFVSWTASPAGYSPRSTAHGSILLARRAGSHGTHLRHVVGLFPGTFYSCTASRISYRASGPGALSARRSSAESG